LIYERRGESEGPEMVVELANWPGDDDRENDVSGTKNMRKKTENAWMTVRTMISCLKLSVD
jgi:hypothetical protein